MDHFELEPIELLVGAVADLEVRILTSEGGDEFELDPAYYVTSLAATTEVEFFLHALPTGITRKLDPEMATGRVPFHPLIDASAFVFLDDCEPFGAQWPNPVYSRLREWVDHWRSAHGLFTPPSSLYAFLTNSDDSEDSENSEDSEDWDIVTPVYMVTLRRSDIERAADLVRKIHAGTFLAGPPIPAITKALPQPPPNKPTLTTKEVATMLGRTDWTVRQWRGQGKGPPFHKTGRGRAAGVYYLTEEVEAWLRARER